MNAPTTTPLEAVIEGDAKIRLGDQAVTAIRYEQINELTDAKDAADAAYDALGWPGAIEARGQLEALGAALDRCRRATDALWYLAPDDGQPLDEEGR